MNLVISDPKTRKAYNVNTEKPVFIGKKIGDEVDLSAVGLPGYKGVISGGSDKDGFPMKPTLPGTARKMLFMAGGVGYRPRGKGIRKRKRVRGNTIAEDIHQVNIKVTQYGDRPLEELLKKEASEKSEDSEEKKEEKQGESK